METAKNLKSFLGCSVIVHSFCPDGRGNWKDVSGVINKTTAKFAYIELPYGDVLRADLACLESGVFNGYRFTILKTPQK